MRAPLVPLLVVLACGPGAPAIDDSTGGATTSAGDTAVTTGAGDDEPPQYCIEQRKYDVLFVVEDAPMMAAAQTALRDHASDLLDFIIWQGDIDYRVGFTHAEIVGPHCPGTIFDDGALLTSSCRAHLGDFPDGLAAACTDACSLETIATQPTAIAGSDELQPRPWIENIGGESNLGDVDPLAAVACLAMQGAAGCEYQAPFTALTRALERTADPADPAFGFLRADAELIVVLAAASPECSFAAGDLEILDPAGDRVFWSDPDVATPGVCWNAGVRCTGGPGEFTDCVASNHDLAGAADVADDQAVLRPVGEVADTLRALVEGRRTLGVSVLVLGGVEVDRETAPFSEQCAPEQLAATAICPGCSTQDGLQASPPVRLQALAEALRDDDKPRTVSLCGPPGPLRHSVDKPLGGQIRPMCLETCARDARPDTPLLDPICKVVQTSPNQPPVELPVCDEVLGEPQPPAGADACFMALVDFDGTQTPSQLDDMSAECRDAGLNVEFRIVRTSPRVDGRCVSGTCEVSSDPTRDCPYL